MSQSRYSDTAVSASKRSASLFRTSRRWWARWLASSRVRQRSIQTHGGSTTEDGTRSYICQQQTPPDDELWIVDSSEVAHRVPNPKPHMIAGIPLQDNQWCQAAYRVTYNGHPFLIQYGERSGAADCSRSKDNWANFAYPRIYDLADERHPKLVSTTKLLILGAIAGSTIFVGLPLGRLSRPMPRMRAALNAVAIGILRASPISEKVSSSKQRRWTTQRKRGGSLPIACCRRSCRSSCSTISARATVGPLFESAAIEEAGIRVSKDGPRT